MHCSESLAGSADGQWDGGRHQCCSYQRGQEVAPVKFFQYLLEDEKDKYYTYSHNKE